MNPIQLFDSASSTYTYVLFDERTRDALIIDPVDDQIERDLAALRQYGLNLLWTVETHAHADHITSAGLLAEHTGARTAAPDGCGITTAAVQLRDGDELEFGGQKIRALLTPGHTAGSMSYLWSSGSGLHVFTGDTLLINGCGRADFQSGSAQALYHSLTQVLFALPDDTVVWPGHDYNCRTQSTIGAEKKSNARVAGKSLEEFVAIMDALHLPRPRRMDEAVPANLMSGLRHDAGGGAFLFPAAPRRRLCGRRFGATGLAMGAGRRGGAGGCAHRCRTRVGRICTRRGGIGLETMAGYGDEPCVRRGHPVRRRRWAKAGAPVP
jgi:sulfur dioxygenase